MSDGIGSSKIVYTFCLFVKINCYISEKLTLLEQEKFWAKEFRSKQKDHRSWDARVEQIENNLLA